MDGHVATITLNRPDQRNPLSGQMLRDLIAAVAWCRSEPAVRVIVLTGAGDRVFCAGADLSSFDGGMSDLERHRSRDLFVELFALSGLLVAQPVLDFLGNNAREMIIFRLSVSDVVVLDRKSVV